MRAQQGPTPGIAGLLGVLLFAGTLEAAPPVHDCDRLAAYPGESPVAVPGVPHDQITPKQAIPACEKALAAWPGTPRLEFQLGRALQAAGKYAEATRRYRKAAEAGFAPAEVNLGNAYKNGIGIAQDHEQAFEWYRRAAEDGNPRAEGNLGELYEFGLGVEKDPSKAAEWYRRAAEKDDILSQVRLSALYYSGNGVEQNLEEAVRWLQRAAEAENAYAEYALAMLYESGEGVERDLERAAELLKNAAHRGLPEAMHALAHYYYLGDALEKDNEKAFHWYRQAAKQGYEPSVAWLTRNYNMALTTPEMLEGAIVSRDLTPREWREEAAQWFIDMARRGDPAMQYMAAQVYEKGVGVGKDLEEALAWYRRAARHKYEDAAKRAETLEAELQR